MGLVLSFFVHYKYQESLHTIIITLSYLHYHYITMAQRPNPKTGCLTAVVRRLLCSGSQQTHPSDTILDSSEETLQLLIPYQEPEETKKELANPQNDDVLEVSEVSEVSALPPPNVVAKLMGLENNPEPGSNRFRYFDDSGSAVARSKSVNFMDYILRVQEEEEDDKEDKESQRKSRRVKASVSFREIVPTSARWSSNSNQQKNKHDFLLLYLDKLDEKRELVNGISSSSSLSRSKRFEKVLEVSKKTPSASSPGPKDEKVAKKFKDEPRKAAKKKKKKNENGSDVNGAKKVRWFLSPSKSNNKFTSEKTALLGESSPENKSSPSNNASPVSVLDRDLYDYLILDDDYYFSGGDSESASELSTKQMETTTKTKSSSSSLSSSPSRTRTNTNNSDSSEETEFITKLMNMLSDLSEEDMKSSSTWVSTISSTKPVDYSQVEDFCVEFGQEILDLVMDQLVYELCI